MLAGFNFVIRYIEGPKNVVADALSRRADHQQQLTAKELQGKEVKSAEFLAALELYAKREEAPVEAPKQHDCCLCAAQLLRPAAQRKRQPAAPRQRKKQVKFGPEPDPEGEERQRREVELQRQRNRAAATEVVPPSPDLPPVNRKGVRVMPTQRCTADGKNGKQCGAKTKKGQYCYAHRKKISGTKIAPAQKQGAGMGLHAERDFKKNEVVADYSGELVDSSGGGAYYLQLRKDGSNDCIDAARTNAGDGRWVNDPRGTGRRANCYFALQPGTSKVRLRTMRSISKGAEFLVSYGRSYWDCLQRKKKAVSRENRKKAPVAPAAPAADHLGQLLAAAELSAATLIRGDFELVAEAREAAQRDTVYQSWLKNPPSGMTSRDGLLWREGVLCVPDDLTLRTKLIAELHDTPTGGHAGRDKTIQAMQKRFHWSGMATMVAAYIGGCDMCQRVKHRQQRTSGLLMPLSVPERIDSDWTMDHITGLPKTERGNDAIQLHCSRGGSIKRLGATDSTVDSKRAADLFVSCVLRHHGVPTSIVSDRGPQFVAEFWEALWKRIGTQLNRSTAHHAQSDGKSEREGKTLETWLRAFCTEFPKEWDSLLPLAELALNSQPTAGGGVSPYQLLYGREPALSVDHALAPPAPTPDDEQPSPNVEAAKQRWAQMSKAWELVRGKLMTAQQRMKHYADQHRREVHFKVGDQVLLSTEHLKFSDSEFNRKLAHLFCGPFPIKSIINDNAYELELPSHMRIHPTVNISHLRAYRDGKATFPSRPSAPGLDRPAPAAVDPVSGEEEYDVERVLSQRGRGKNAKYLVLWKGYPYAEATWEPASALSKAPEMLADYNKYVASQRGSTPPSRPESAGTQALGLQAQV
jgi:hypothetical protein